MRTRGKAAIFTALAVVAAGMTTTLLTQGAYAHGAMQSPATRTYACYVDGLTSSHEIKPKNPACAEAVAVGGTQPLYDWYGVLRSDGAGRTRGFIPDGQICSGGNPKYAAYDAPRADWPVTRVQPGQNFDFVYGAWVPHPGGFRLYITKDGFDPTKPLTWDDFEEEPFFEANPQPPLDNGAYRWTTRLPNKTGRHIIYSVWARTDSPETFYNCSDVVFDGGNGEVTGIRGTLPNPPNTSPSPGVPNTSPSPGVPNTSPSPSPSSGNGSGPGNGACTATYRQVGSWSGGFQGEVTVQNSTSSSLNSWTVKMSFPGNLTLNSLWNGVHTTSGSEVTVKNAAWNGSIGPNASTTFGFVASGSASTPSLTCSSP